MKLTDGGVHNNLGTGWFDETKNQESRLWRYGNRPNTKSIKPTSRQIIVNSGAASRGSRRVPSLMVPFRTMSILYDNTVKPRLDQFRHEAADHVEAPAVIDITQSPYHLADQYSQSATDDSGYQKKRSDDIRDRLRSAWGERYWTDFARHTSSTPTKLTKAGQETGARILWHGYLSTLVTLHSLWGVPLPKIIWGEEHFLEMAGRPSNPTPTPNVDSIDQQINMDTQVGRLAPAPRL
jgi:hypothetical protein